MNPTDYDFLRRFLLRTSGLNLGETKQYLINGRLAPVAQRHGCAGVPELVARLSTGGHWDLERDVVEAMTTNETMFFRDAVPFEELRDVALPRLIAARRDERKLKLWSAACSTGQEPYSLAILLHEHFPELLHWDVQIIATDISEDALARARAGVYTQFEVSRGVSDATLAAHFERVEEGWRIQERLRRQVTWRQLNLLGTFAGLGRFDVVLCRNVLIYFDTQAKSSVFSRLAETLRPDGYLVLGSAETVLGTTDRFARDRIFRSAIYTPRTAIAAGECPRLFTRGY